MLNLEKSANTLINVFKAALFGYLLKTFCLSFYKVPSNSMENSLIPGDGILISKMTYGPRLYFGELSFFSSSIFQLPGFGRVNRNDVIVFNSPKEQDLILVKRCIGLPGDIIHIENEKVLLGGKVVHEDVPIYKYWVYTKQRKEISKVLDSMRLLTGQFYYRISKGYFVATLNKRNVNVLKDNKYVDSVKREIPEDNSPIFNSWTKDDFGPITVPKQGTMIILDSASLSNYADIIAKENKSVEFSENGVYINGLFKTNYTFKNNYYFMMGDNRDNSTDSRWIGFVPESYLIGKVFLVLYSLDYSKNSLRKNRFLRGVE